MHQRVPGYFSKLGNASKAQLINVTPHGQCALAKSSTNLVLMPHNGNKLIIQGVPQIIPDAGVTLGAGGLTSATLYYTYAAMSGTAIALEASTTGYATQAGTGVPIKSGDPSRSLVGMARTNGSAAWTDSANQRFVRSYYNDPQSGTFNTFSADRTTTSTTPTYVELNSEIRIEQLLWAGEQWLVQMTGTLANNTNTDLTYVAIGIDSTSTAETNGSFFVCLAVGGSSGSASCMTVKSGLSEGYHFATLLGCVNGGTGTFYGSSKYFCSMTGVPLGDP